MRTNYGLLFFGVSFAFVPLPFWLERLFGGCALLDISFSALEPKPPSSAGIHLSEELTFKRSAGSC